MTKVRQCRWRQAISENIALLEHFGHMCQAEMATNHSANRLMTTQTLMRHDSSSQFSHRQAIPDNAFFIRSEIAHVDTVLPTKHGYLP